ncbi:alanine--tRNA ligase [Buchnera aphidicola (Muscaphis stroyani)]|uniref:Alanine--tRNA ligase n=1 Tax=Buchnera aphidicola (Muscaphis stroyani) TaxID=1241869 RepID=A0A4D6YF98_9GAMM|nr:alanine--tRNA ligase [Buchnera aphidicola]QCI24458.1 alanine--tRNA ligase [Buchnera aphidicola (Muscaphis stroyani)]
MNKSTNQIRQDFLNFFKEKKHVIIPSSSLVPNNDSTLLFTNAGMNQFKDIFLGLKKTKHARVTTVQRCLRTGGKHNDLENVGYTHRHHTFFEMLGNFSFGDYFKKKAIMYAWELLTSKKWFNIPKHRLWITVYEHDDETYKIWNQTIQIPSERIIKIGDYENHKYNSDNFWQMGDSGPCGPCTEIFYDYGKNALNSSSEFIKNENHRFVEIWNIVFIEYNRISQTQIISLKQKSIDTGMGLERISSILQNVNSNYNIDIFQTLIKSISQFSKVQDFNNISLKVIADHIRACSFIIADNIFPSNEQHGYVLRRIIRRALSHGYKIGIKQHFFYKLVPNVIRSMGISANILKDKQKKIEDVLKSEEMQFSKTLEKGLQVLNKEIKNLDNQILPGEIVFYLHDTFGFPSDLTEDFCREKNIKIDHDGYQKAKKNQKNQSNLKKPFYKNYNNNIFFNDSCIFEGYQKHKTKSIIKYIFVKDQSVLNITKNEVGIIYLDKTSFYAESGGQIGDIGYIYYKKSCFIVEKTKKYGNTIGHIGKLISGTMTVNQSVYNKIDKLYRSSVSLNHSATHLLHAALRNTLGDGVVQKGSFICNSYLRFDFSYSKLIDTFHIQEIENIVNVQIRNNIFIKIKEMSFEEAKTKKATALFENQYKSTVRVVFISNFSIELCGGTHAKRTGDIGLLKIISQSSVASGIKRIEAVTGQEAINYFQKQDNNIQDISFMLKVKSFDMKEKIKKLIHQIKYLEKKIQEFQKKENTHQVKTLSNNAYDIQGTKVLIHTFYNYDHKSLRVISDQITEKLKSSIIVLVNVTNNHFNVITKVTKNLINFITASSIINMIVTKTNGKGGGKKHIAEGRGLNINIIPEILQNIKIWINKKLKNK